MAHGPIYRVAFRRRREGRTDYRSRLALLKGRTTRIVVRRSNRNTVVQFVDFDPKGDVVRAQASATELVAHGWQASRTSTPAAFLTGMLAGLRAKQAGIEAGVLDIGRRPPVRGGRSYAALKGALEAGIEVPHDEEVLPAEDRLNGSHLGEEIPALVEQVKQKLGGMVTRNG